MSLFYAGQMTCSKSHLKTLQIVLQKLRKYFNPTIIRSILPLVVYSLVMPAGLLIGAKCFQSFCIYISHDSSQNVTNGSLNPYLFFLDSVHQVEKVNLKLAELIYNSIANCKGVICKKHKQFLKLYKMAVFFRLDNFDFSPLCFSTVFKSVFSVSASLSFATARRSSSYVSTLSLNSRSDPQQHYDATVFSSNFYPRKPNRFSRPVYLGNIRPGKLIILNNFYPSKGIFPRNNRSSKSVCSSDVCQSRSDVSPSKLICLSGVCPGKPTCTSNVIPIKLVGPSNPCLSKTARPKLFQ